MDSQQRREFVAAWFAWGKARRELAERASIAERVGHVGIGWQVATFIIVWASILKDLKIRLRSSPTASTG